MFMPWYRRERQETLEILRLIRGRRMFTRSGTEDTTQETTVTLREWLDELRALRRMYGHI
jgi:hypothetical protein